MFLIPRNLDIFYGINMNTLHASALYVLKLPCELRQTVNFLLAYSLQDLELTYGLCLNSAL